MKHLFSIILVMTCCMQLQAQTQTVAPKMARVAGKGMMIFVGDKIAADNGPVTGYSIERKGPGDADYREITVLKPVGSFTAFKNNFNNVNTLLPYTDDLSGFDLDSIWRKGTAAGTVKKLGIAGISLPVLVGFNLVWLDASVQEGVTYEYRVKSMGANSVVSSGPVKYSKNVPMAALHYRGQDFSSMQHQAVIYWSAYGKDKPYHIDVYRCGDDKKYVKVPAVAYVTPLRDTFLYRIIDSTAVPAQYYHYYMTAYDVLGNTVKPADTIAVATLDYQKMPMPEMVHTYGDPSARAIHVGWRLPDAALIKKISLYRSTSSVSNFTLLANLSPADTSYTDQQVMPAKPYFYYFALEYKTSDESRRTSSFAGKYEHAGKPDAPHNVKAVATQQGITVTWDYDGMMAEGFRVYRNAGAGQMQLISSLVRANDTIHRYSFTDRDTSLSGGTFYGYTVMTVSTSNVESSFADTAVAAPLKSSSIPAAPMHVAAGSNSKGIFISWDDMSAGGVAGYLLVRTDSKGSTDTFRAGVNLFTDTTARAGSQYTYEVITVSLFGIRSLPSDAVTASVTKISPAPPSALRSAPVDGGVYISWQLPDAAENYNYKLYRYVRGNTPELLASLKSDADSFTDKTAKKGTLYFYFIRSEAGDKTEGERSKETGITYE